MRAIWKGAVSFGLVSIAVRLYAATEEKDVRFHQVHGVDGGRVKYKRVCTVDGEEVPYGEIAKGYELDSGEVVVITDEDLADLPLTTSRSIDVLQFVPAEQVDPILQAKSYYLEPDKAAVKPYVLLRDALEQSERVAVVKVALRQRETLATLRVLDGVLVMHTMLWPDEVRTPDFEVLDSDVTVRPQELTMATSLVESMADDFDPTAYSDGYREALQAVISAKVEGREVVEAPASAPAASGVVDLMTALRESVERAKQSRAGGAGEPPAATAGEAPAAAEAEAATETGEAAVAAGAAGAPAERAPARKASRGKTAAATAAAAEETSATRARTRKTAARTDAAATEEDVASTRASVRRTTAKAPAAAEKAAPTKKAASTTKASTTKASATKPPATKAPAAKTAAARATAGAAPAAKSPAAKVPAAKTPAAETPAAKAPAAKAPAGKTPARTSATARAAAGAASATPPAPKATSATRRRKTA